MQEGGFDGWKNRRFKPDLEGGAQARSLAVILIYYVKSVFKLSEFGN